MPEKMSSTLPGFDSKESGPVEESSGALVGKALIKAIKMGDGQAVFDAYAAMQREFEKPEEDEEMSLDDEMLDA